MHSTLTRSTVVWLAGAAVLCGCGSKQSAGGAAAASAAQHAPNPAQTLSRTMVGAVAANKPAAVPVQVRFSLHTRPEVSQPLEIGLALLPTSAAIDRISGEIVTDGALELVEGAQIRATDRPAEGVPIEHTVKVLPKRDGIYTFNAVITVDSGNKTSTESFSMPVIVGEGIGNPSPTPTAGSAGSHSAATAAAK
jgi:hypothetical protein